MDTNQISFGEDTYKDVGEFTKIQSEKRQEARKVALAEIQVFIHKMEHDIQRLMKFRDKLVEEVQGVLTRFDGIKDMVEVAK